MKKSRQNEAHFAEVAWQDYCDWETQSKHEVVKPMLKRINQLIQDIQREPFAGIGKPEPLKHAIGGYWSRRINDEHRILYKVEADSLLTAQLRHHY